MSDTPHISLPHFSASAPQQNIQTNAAQQALMVKLNAVLLKLDDDVKSSDITQLQNDLSQLLADINQANKSKVSLFSGMDATTIKKLVGDINQAIAKIYGPNQLVVVYDAISQKFTFSAKTTPLVNNLLGLAKTSGLTTEEVNTTTINDLYNLLNKDSKFKTAVQNILSGEISSKQLNDLKTIIKELQAQGFRGFTIDELKNSLKGGLTQSNIENFVNSLENNAAAIIVNLSATLPQGPVPGSVTYGITPSSDFAANESFQNLIDALSFYSALKTQKNKQGQLDSASGTPSTPGGAKPLGAIVAPPTGGGATPTSTRTSTSTSTPTSTPTSTSTATSTATPSGGNGVGQLLAAASGTPDSTSAAGYGFDAGVTGPLAQGLGYPNVNALLMIVLMEAYHEGNDELLSMMNSLNASTQQRQKDSAQLAADQAALNKATPATGGGSPSKAETTAQGAVTIDQNKIASDGGDAQIIQLNLQAIAQNQQQTLSMMSAWLKNMNDNSMSIIRHIGGG